MTGDQADMVARMRAVLPARWFPDDAPILDGVLNGLASGWSWLFQLLQYVTSQTRLATATGVWLDVIAQDFCGTRLTRRSGQSDDAYRHRIRQELLRERGTRNAVSSVLLDLTGRSPAIFEPGLTGDTGGYGSVIGGGGGIGYGTGGGWGSLDLPFQCFVTAYRPVGSGISLVSGWGDRGGGYGTGAIEYASLSMVQGQITDADIYTAVASVMPVAATAWTSITD
jgi:hypothetical protein